MKSEGDSGRLDPDRKRLLQHRSQRRLHAEASRWFGIGRGGDQEMAEQASERIRRDLGERHRNDGSA